MCFNVLKVLIVLNLLDMPKYPSLACWALFIKSLRYGRCGRYGVAQLIDINPLSSNPIIPLAVSTTASDLGVSISYHVHTHRLPPVYFMSPMILALTLILAGGIVFLERRCGARTSLPLFLFWGLSTIIHILTFQHYIRLHAGKRELTG